MSLGAERALGRRHLHLAPRGTSPPCVLLSALAPLLGAPGEPGITTSYVTPRLPEWFSLRIGRLSKVKAREDSILYGQQKVLFQTFNLQYMPVCQSHIGLCQHSVIWVFS